MTSGQYLSKIVSGVLLGCAVAAGAAHAGSSGSIVPNMVHAEGGNIYIHGPFANPDQCATSDVVVLQAANEKELDRMMSIVLTAAASGKKINMWFIGCVPVPWYASAPRAVSMSFEK